MGDRSRKLEGTNRGRAEARGAKPLWVSSRHSTRTRCVPCFFRAPACLRARSPTARNGHDGTTSRINRSGELRGNGQTCRGAGGACRSGAWRRKSSNHGARKYCDSISDIGYSHVLSISMDTCPLRMPLPVPGSRSLHLLPQHLPCSQSRQAPSLRRTTLRLCEPEKQVAAWAA